MRKHQMAIVTRRILERDGRPAAYDEKFIPYERGIPSIEFELHFSEFPDMFEDRFAPMSLCTEMTIGVETAPGHVAAALGIAEAAPLLVVSRLIRAAEEKSADHPDGKPLGYGKQYLTEAFGKLSAKSGIIRRNCRRARRVRRIHTGLCSFMQDFMQKHIQKTGCTALNCEVAQPVASRLANLAASCFFALFQVFREPGGMDFAEFLFFLYVSTFIVKTLVKKLTIAFFVARMHIGSTRTCKYKFEPFRVITLFQNRRRNAAIWI
jgi:hypothetical protein